MPTSVKNSGFSPGSCSNSSEDSLVRAQLELGELLGDLAAQICIFCSCSEPGAPPFTLEEISHVGIEEPGHCSQD